MGLHGVCEEVDPDVVRFHSFGVHSEHIKVRPSSPSKNYASKRFIRSLSGPAYTAEQVPLSKTLELAHQGYADIRTLTIGEERYEVQGSITCNQRQLPGGLKLTAWFVHRGGPLQWRGGREWLGGKYRNAAKLRRSMWVGTGRLEEYR